MKIYELMPLATQQKSFGGKAKVIIKDDNTEILYSYDTQIMYRDAEGNYHRTYNGWTQTTGKHIRAFANMGKTEFLNLALENEVM